MTTTADARPTAAEEPVEQSGRGPDRLLLAILGVVVLALVAVLAWSAGRPSYPADASAAAGFARDMSLHHSQAVDMALRVRDRTDDAEVRQIALDIVLTQQNQIGRMQGWLEIWGLPFGGGERAMAWMGMPVDGLMPGMATSAQLAALDSASGTDAERLFLELMIAHHRAGIDMAEAVLDRTDEPEARRLAETMVAGQASEIAAMTDVLEGLPAEDA